MFRFLFLDRKFTPLFWTQFLGALNDNFLKNAMVVMITFKGVQLMGMDSKSLVAFATGLFILPFFLFSPIAGQLSDKFERSQIIRYTKVWEFLIMLVAGLGFYFETFSLLMFVLFLMGLQSTFFGPVKFSILPDILKNEDLLKGNAYIELGTFLAILLGTIAGGLSAFYPWVIIISLLWIALLGVLMSWKVPKTPIAAPNLKIEFNPLPEIISLNKIIRQRKSIYNSVLAISWFWFFGAGVLSVLPIYCKNYLNVNEQVVTLFLAMFTIGIGVGSILSEKLSFKRVEIGLVPIGSIGLTLFLVDLYFVKVTGITHGNSISIQEMIHSAWGIRILFDFFMMSVSGGIFIVPLYTLLQERSLPESRSRVIAGNNIVNSLFMVVSSLLVMWFYHMNLNEAEIFLVLAIMNVVVAIYIYSVVPEFTLRFISWILSRLLYRIKVIGIENIPASGGCLLASNHVSFVDWLLIMATCKRPTRFIMYYKFFNIPFIKKIMKQAKVIPIAGSKEDLEIMKKAFVTASIELKKGEVICIFPEGSITNTGELDKFRPGIMSILEKDPVPVVPIAIKGMWGSFFSRKDGPALKKPPRKFQSRIEIQIGKPISPTEFNLGRLKESIHKLIEQG